ncbi:DUF4139 domain-containing protein [Roseateles oligotrophus]|uniref:DUF4139 domain-containing protein n=1 Tax=Roseateles oligotrophus TaxID=1769250 RepID=A0ABT2YLS8_9BURK|nr:DUF4139 domain-containing protein [Roseateles oligotrophus]MCV2371018.1 DUF4139 domain-containing protein [Roseateles oligotrophus]
MTPRLLLPLLLALPGLAQAQSSKISHVLVYPGGATVERVAKVAAGAQTLKLSCLPTRFDLDSLQLQGDTGTQIGDVSVQTMARERAPECASSPLDASIRALEDKQADLKAEIDAHELVLGFLKNFGMGSSPGAGNQVAIGSTAESLRRSGLEAMQRQHQLLRKKQLIEQDLTPLLAERDRLIKANPQLRSLQIRLAAEQAGELRLSYRVSQAGWTPVYRAHLDTAKGQLRLERQAQVAQNSGEDWSGVKLRLSTVQPRQNTGIAPPYPWTLDILPPLQAQAEMQFSREAPAPPAMAIARSPLAQSQDESARFDVSVFQGEFAAEFGVPGLVNVASDGQRVGYSLGSELVDAQVLRRVQPQQEAQAFLMAELARPAGSWPSGALQLFRDGDFVGNSQLNLGSEERLELFFGRDEMLRVKVEPEQRGGANAGFIGSRAEQKIGRAFVLENLHKKPVQLQVLEASPVGRHEDIRVQTVFNPKPSLEAWKKQPGVVAWELPLEAGKTLRITAEYSISYPKDARIGGLR